METALFDRSLVREHTPPEAVIAAMEAAFTAFDAGDVVMPAKTYIELPAYHGDFRAMPSYVNAGSWDAAGVKWVNVHPDNPAEHELPTVMALMILSDPATALPLAVMDGTELTRQRTGAAAALATDHLAIAEARTLGIIGAGEQAHPQLACIAAVRPIEEVIVADHDPAAITAFKESVPDRFVVREGSVGAAAACDILCTLTPVRSPLVERGMLGPQTHVNAIGADAPGKQELAAEIVADAKLVIDEYEQCVHSGEINVPWQAGELSDEDIHATLGAVVTGRASGRTDSDGITVFDSTGLAIQDVATARVVYEAASSASGFDFLEVPSRD